MESAEQEAFEVGDNRVDSGQPVVGLLGRGDLGDVGGLDAQSREGGEGVGMTHRPWLQTPRCEVDDLPLAKRVECLNDNEAGFAILVFLNGPQHRCTPTAASGFAGFVGTDVGIVDFDQLGEPVVAVARSAIAARRALSIA